MNTKLVQSKTELISNRMRDEIISGRFTGGQLPSKLDLAAHFGVSHRTMETVLKRLREEGLIRCVRGTGIFVNTDVREVTNVTPRLTVMFLPQYSIFEDEPYNTLRVEAFSRGLLPVNLPMPDRYIKLSLQEKTLLTQVLKAPIRGVLYNGRGYRSEPFLDNWRNLRSVGLIKFDSENEPPGSTVLIDYEAGAEKIARHFIEQGCRRLLILAGFLHPDIPKSKKYWEKHVSTQFFNGVSRAASEAGLQKPELHYIQHPPENTDVFSPGLSDEMAFLLKKYDGIICTIDLLAYAVVAHARKLGIRVPDDLLVSAERDTAWCSKFGVNLTSLSLRYAELSKTAFDILETGGIHHEKIIPDLITRETSLRK